MKVEKNSFQTRLLPHLRHKVCHLLSSPVTPDFKWQGWLNGGKNQNPKKSLGLQTNPKKSLDQNLTPQKCHAEFPSHKNFQRNYTARIRGENTQELSHAGTITNLQVVLNTQKHPYLNQPNQKNTCHSFTTEKKNRNWKFHTHKNPSIKPVTWNPEYPPPPLLGWLSTLF